MHSTNPDDSPPLYSSKDSAKYDAIHNRHLVDKEGSCIKELYEVAKELAGAIIPSEGEAVARGDIFLGLGDWGHLVEFAYPLPPGEYGTDAKSKLTIGSKICGEVNGRNGTSITSAGLQQILDLDMNSLLLYPVIYCVIHFPFSALG